ncbi:MAG: hypothetical protein EOM15_13675 [Spirochaetia bacterium]|nr:hypothetical protein [Spirochaetia bacterium]
MKRSLLLFLVCLCSLVNLIGLDLVKAYPDALSVRWDVVQDADYYDVYLDKKPLVRLLKNEYVVSNLQSYHSYEVLVAARKSGNVDLSAQRSVFSTIGWDTSYQWINTTTKDNKGRCRILDFLVVRENDSYLIYSKLSDEYHLVSPLVDQSLIGVEIPYEGDAPHQVAYRLNAQVFNTTSFTPKLWKVIDYSVDDKQIVTQIQTRLGSMSFHTTSRYTFALGNDGQRQLIFETKGTGMASWGLFQSPLSGDKGAFICTEMAEPGHFSLDTKR